MNIIKTVSVVLVMMLIIMTIMCSLICQSSRAHLHMAGMLRFVFDVNQPGLSTPFYPVLVSISVFVVLSTVFRSAFLQTTVRFLNSVLSALFLPYWSPQLYLSLWVSFSPDIILYGWLGLKYQPTNSYLSFLLQSTRPITWSKLS